MANLKEKKNNGYTPDYTPIHTNLTDNSWLDEGDLPEKLTENFDTLYNLHPDEYGKIIIFGKKIDTPRYQQTYGRDYTFSGINHAPLELPDEFKPFLEWANSLDYGPFNQVLVNWYANGNHYIGAHSDDERQLIKHSPIVSISLGATRTFRLRKKGESGIFKDILMPDGTVLVMGGKFQSEFKHEVPKINGKKGHGVGRRINITFRQFEK